MRCDCGSKQVVRARTFKNSVSCGCLQRERVAEIGRTVNRKHGGYGSTEYNTWANIIARCERVADNTYPNYGGRGITICPRWRESFAAFLEDVGPRPSARYSIDRIDNDGNYEPGNVRWATRSQQSRNRRDRKTYTFNGCTMLLSDWSKHTGIHLATLHSRIKRGWSIERALSESVHFRG